MAWVRAMLLRTTMPEDTWEPTAFSEVGSGGSEAGGEEAGSEARTRGSAVSRGWPESTTEDPSHCEVVRELN